MPNKLDKGLSERVGYPAVFIFHESGYRSDTQVGNLNLWMFLRIALLKRCRLKRKVEFASIVSDEQ
ncbi:hypothetical protein WL67_32070 [Burkholderia ubonensis]|nr:hypothetical protein WJ67_10550 [Burkholderia ubonensis]KWD48633.1 hypothetical protein WL66_21360 [Burkholderia ubonensis]KWD64679.1 hypothetical protein WL67_32070 [Burkholderia ubonensis]